MVHNMCPASAADADPLSDDMCSYYCTDEEAIVYLLRLEHGGCPLPSNVTKDVDPYCHSPENLPNGIWYLAQLRENIDTENGFWKATGSPCRVFVKPPISGWRTNMEFYEGPGPNPQETIWVMQQFQVTRDGSKPDINIKGQEGTTLCRVFQCSELHNHTEQGSTCAHQENDKFCSGFGWIQNPSSPPNDVAEDLPENDFIARGDYLELWDLSVPVSSPSSRSDNSTCLSLSSGECFDSLALLRDLEQEPAPENSETKEDTNCHLSVSASTRSGNVVLEPPTHEGCSYAVPASNSGQSSDTKEEEKVVGRMKKLKKKYLCFMPF